VTGCRPHAITALSAVDSTELTVVYATTASRLSVRQNRDGQRKGDVKKTEHKIRQNGKLRQAENKFKEERTAEDNEKHVISYG
jgi:hypothetical protein